MTGTILDYVPRLAPPDQAPMAHYFCPTLNRAGRHVGLCGAPLAPGGDALPNCVVCEDLYQRFLRGVISCPSCGVHLRRHPT